MSLESFVNSEVRFLKEHLEKYHSVMDYLLGFLTEKQWQQALADALQDECHLDYSIMEEVFIDYIKDWNIDTDVDEVILKACYEVRKHDQHDGTITSNYETIIKNLEVKKEN